ncbi:MAG TPA: NADH-quinone oxidoreductase subunit M [Candidatus Acidoferrales bacterium]|nr:NADH-quinone oxidoreductase subunit M [Candidatus Acidoferrales bacterium]
MNLLPIMVLIPAVALALIAMLKERHSKMLSVVSTGAVLAISIALLALSILGGTVSFSQQYSYIGSLGVGLGFSVGIIQLILLLVSSSVLFVAALSGNAEDEKHKLSSFFVVLFQLASIGLFSSANFFLFFIFWDVGVIALFFMINTLGSANRKSASINFLIYELFASALLLLAILLIYFYTPVNSFDLSYIAAHAGLIPHNVQIAVFALLFVAFMINMPLFPVHFWLPDAHTEASTQGSMLLSGVLTKYGGYGMLLLFTIFPISAEFSKYVGILAAVSAFYAVFVLMRQTDLKRIIAYSTIVEMGIIMFGISAANSSGIYGATYGMLAHGLTVALMFLAVGVIKHAFGERDIRVLKGLVVNAKSTTYVFLIGALAMIGFPFSAAFIADILIFIGTIQAFGVYGILPLGAIALLGAYLYYVINKSMLSTKEVSSTVAGITLRNKIGYVLLVLLIFAFGTLPFLLLNLVKV